MTEQEIKACLMGYRFAVYEVANQLGWGTHVSAEVRDAINRIYEATGKLADDLPACRHIKDVQFAVEKELGINALTGRTD